MTASIILGLPALILLLVGGINLRSFNRKVNGLQEEAPQRKESRPESPPQPANAPRTIEGKRDKRRGEVLRNILRSKILWLVASFVLCIGLICLRIPIINGSSVWIWQLDSTDWNSAVTIGDQWIGQGIDWLHLGLRQALLVGGIVLIIVLRKLFPRLKGSLASWWHKNETLLWLLAYLSAAVACFVWVPATHTWFRKSYTEYVWLWDVGGDSIRLQTVFIEELCVLFGMLILRVLWSLVTGRALPALQKHS
jgi:hypothetical protein